MSKFLYIGKLANGAIVKRSSTRSDFVYAVVWGPKNYRDGEVVGLGATNWSTTRAGAFNLNPRLAKSGADHEMVVVHHVTAEQYRNEIRNADKRFDNKAEAVKQELAKGTSAMLNRTK